MSCLIPDGSCGDKITFVVKHKHTFIDIQCCESDQPVLRRRKSDPLCVYAASNTYPTCASKWPEILTSIACDDCFSAECLHTDNNTPTTAPVSDDDAEDDEVTGCGKQFSFAGAIPCHDADVNRLHEHDEAMYAAGTWDFEDFQGYGCHLAPQAVETWQPASVWPEMCNASALLSTHQQLLPSGYQWCGDASSRIPMVCNNAPGASAVPMTLLPPPPPPPQEKSTAPCAPRDEESAHAPMTLMVRNLPEDLSQPALVEQIIDGGYKGLFDFVYMPMNFRGFGNFGYAFVNFISHDLALQFMSRMNCVEHGQISNLQKWDIVWSTCQGFNANIERYRNSPLMHELVPKECKPAVYDGIGLQVAFPQPTKTIPKPRIHWPGPKDGKANAVAGNGDLLVEARISQSSVSNPKRRPGRSKQQQQQQQAIMERRM